MEKIAWWIDEAAAINTGENQWYD